MFDEKQNCTFKIFEPGLKVVLVSPFICASGHGLSDLWDTFEEPQIVHFLSVSVMIAAMI